MKKTKLGLARETIRNLESAELARIRGAGDTSTTGTVTFACPGTPTVYPCTTSYNPSFGCSEHCGSGGRSLV